MAISANTVWEIRGTNGSDSNGGGFNPKNASAGTDKTYGAGYGAVTRTDLVVDATTNTIITSAGNPFAAGDVGNIIQITAGAGWTTGFYEILSVATAKATLDRSPGATSITGGTGTLGGALATVQKADQLGIMFVKANGEASQTNSAAIVLASSTGVIGYNTTRYDILSDFTLTRPVITLSGNLAGCVLSLSTANSIVAFMTLDTGAFGAQNAYKPGAAGHMFFGNKILGTYNQGGASTRMAFNDNGQANVKFISNEVDVTASDWVAGVGKDGIYAYNYFHDCGTVEVLHDMPFGGAGSKFIVGNNFYNVGKAIGAGNSSNVQVSYICNNTINTCSSDAIKIGGANPTAQTIIMRNVIVLCGGWGINLPASTPNRGLILDNAFYSNTSGNINNLDTVVDGITNAAAFLCTGDPISGASTADFTLDNVAGEGKVCVTQNVGAPPFGKFSLGANGWQNIVAGGGGGNLLGNGTLVIG